MSAQQILSDPSLETAPDFLSADYNNIRAALHGQRSVSDADIVTELTALWTLLQGPRQAAWDRQVLAEKATEDARILAEVNTATAAATLIIQEKADAEKKRPKVGDFVVGVAVPDVIRDNPSQYALHKLLNRDIVELWYFTPEGRKEAALTAKTISKDTFSLARTDNALSLRASTSHCPSPKVMQDRNLLWTQMTLGKNKMLECMLACGWPAKHIRSLKSFFYGLDCHVIRDQDMGDEALLLYQECMHAQWHLNLKRDRGWDISCLSVTLLQWIHTELVQREAASLICQVSYPPALLITHN